MSTDSGNAETVIPKTNAARQVGNEILEQIVQVKLDFAVKLMSTFELSAGLFMLTTMHLQRPQHKVFYAALTKTVSPLVWAALFVAIWFLRLVAYKVQSRRLCLVGTFSAAAVWGYFSYLLFVVSGPVLSVDIFATIAFTDIIIYVMRSNARLKRKTDVKTVS